MMGGMGRTFNGDYAEYTCVPAVQVIAFSSDLDCPPSVPGRRCCRPHMAPSPSAWTPTPGSPSSSGVARPPSAWATAILAKRQGMTVLPTTRNPGKDSALTGVDVDHVLIDDGAVAHKARTILSDDVDNALELGILARLGRRRTYRSSTCSYVAPNASETVPRPH